MKSGDLRHRITLQSPSHSRDEYQQMVPTWTDEATVWAAIEWGSGRRYVEASQLNAEIKGVVRIRYRSDVQPTWRISYDGRYFQILSIANVMERGRELQLNCKEFQD